MKIGNVRLGFATNSSSSHSIVFFNDYIDQDRTPSAGIHNYGWDNFALTSKKQKKNYMAAQLYENLKYYGIQEEHARYILNGIYGIENFDGYVDHQSVLTFPRNWDGTDINMEFVKEYTDYIVNNPKIVINGGNDNDYSDYREYDGKEIDCILPTEEHTDTFVARKDKDYWVIFNRNTGAKLRFSFGESRMEESIAPELVDMKITNWCPFGCDFCYQDSTLMGKTASLQRIQDIIYVLAQLKVLEIALGGGETTMHPNFVEILQCCKNCYIVPNFTTFTLNWLSDSRIENAVKKYCGGFALSCTDSDWKKKINKLNSWLDYNQEFKFKVSVQLILGVMNDYCIKDLLKYIKNTNVKNVTLLGYKSFGRASDTNPIKNNVEGILYAAKEDGINIGMDTAAVKEYDVDLNKVGISKLLHTTAEGKFSMYIDAVDEFITKDSYTKETFKYSPKTYNSESLGNQIKKHFPFKD